MRGGVSVEGERYITELAPEDHSTVFTKKRCCLASTIEIDDDTFFFFECFSDLSKKLL
jgi:hypothetical protein